MSVSTTAGDRTAALPGQRTAPAAPRPGDGFRPDVEGLRAVAVLLVVLGHAGVPGLAGGYVGVDVFFVVSGFLITGLLLREAATGRIRLARFWTRRAVRLLPAATLVSLATLAAAWLWLSPLRTGGYARDAAAAAGYVANLRFALTGTDYLDADAPPSPFQHFWSLAVEEQFYLVWPLLLAAAVAAGRRRRLLGAGLAVLAAVSFAAGVAETHRSAPWAYFGTHARAWELAAGALLALAAPRLGGLRPALRAALGWAGLAAVAAAALLLDDATAYPGWWAALPVAGAVAVLAAGTGGRARGGAGALLERRPMLVVGRLSYSWYLWHWPVLLIGPAALGVADTWPHRVALAAAALPLAAATYRWVENPLRHRAGLRDRPSRGLTLGAGLSGAVVAAAVAAALLPQPVPTGAAAADLAATLDAAADPEAALRRAVAASAGVRALPANLRPALGKVNADKARVWADGCHAESPVTAAPAGCVYGDPAGTATVVLYGDSHAAQWFPALERLALAHRWRLVSLTKSSCSAAALRLWHDGLKREYTECAAYHRSALARVRALRPGLVVVGSSFNYRPAGAPDTAAAWRGGWDRTIGALRGTGAQVALIADTPYFPDRVPVCVARRAEQQRVDRCAVAPAKGLRGPAQRRVVHGYAGRPGVTVVDPVPWVCAAVCPAVVGDVLAYRDANHLTTTFARTVAPVLDRHLPPFR